VSVRIEAPSVTAKNAYRFGSFALAIVVAVAALTVRMFDLQVMQGQGTYSITQGQSAETISVPSSRGLILDSSGNALVKNLPNFVVEIIPKNLPVADKAVVVRRLASLLNMETADIDQDLDSATGSMYNPVEIASNVDTDVARIIDENVDLLPGVQVISQPLRQYTNDGFKQPLYSEILATRACSPATSAPPKKTPATRRTMSSGLPASRPNTKPSCAARPARRRSPSTATASPSQG